MFFKNTNFVLFLESKISRIYMRSQQTTERQNESKSCTLLKYLKCCPLGYKAFCFPQTKIPDLEGEGQSLL